jgi:DNA mismatch repair protein MutL
VTRRIYVLPDTLANQIAAGEVVERPASVVKELVENSLDAAATRVDVAIHNGGKTEIRVADDGCGMDREDALLAFDRHATSKISRPDDLKTVRTFGFRGEALPSIASVSRLTLETAEAGTVGTRVVVNAGRVQGVEDCARQTGTTITVRSLFGNVPARSKFLKGTNVETRAVAEVMTTLALAHLSASFALESNGRTLMELPAAPDLASRVAALWGDDFAGKLVPVGSRVGEFRIAGLVERPDAATPGPRRVHLFVGGRPFRSREIAAAAERGYRTTVAAGMRPSLLLYIDVPAGAVDVNVHPTKAEVRFRDRSAIEEAVETAVRDAMGTPGSAATFDRVPAVPQLRRTPETLPGSAHPEPRADPEAGQLAFFVAASSRADAAPRTSSDVAASPEEDIVQEGVVRDQQPLPASLWQLHDSYILAETRSGLIIIDQHSAHERILFEELMHRFGDGGQNSQRLLFPITLRLSPAEYTVLESSLALFTRTGFEVEAFGGRTMIVQSAPNPHPYFNAERCLRDMVNELTVGSELTRAAHNQHERIAKTYACKAAIKAGQSLSQHEMLDLFEKLFATELPYHDVHGRPTVIRLSLSELERRFGRHG